MKTFTKFIESVTSINGFCVLKPEFLNYEDDWINMLKNNGWTIVQKVKKTLTHNQAEELYKPHKNESFYKDLCNYMCSGDCICCSCYKECDNPIKDMDKLKERVRESWGKDEMKNAMHSSDNQENVERESNICFNNII